MAFAFVNPATLTGDEAFAYRAHAKDIAWYEKNLKAAQVAFKKAQALALDYSHIPATASVLEAVQEDVNRLEAEVTWAYTKYRVIPTLPSN